MRTILVREGKRKLGVPFRLLASMLRIMYAEGGHWCIMYAEGGHWWSEGGIWIDRYGEIEVERERETKNVSE